MESLDKIINFFDGVVHAKGDSTCKIDIKPLHERLSAVMTCSNGDSLLIKQST